MCGVEGRHLLPLPAAKCRCHHRHQVTKPSAELPLGGTMGINKQRVQQAASVSTQHPCVSGPLGGGQGGPQKAGFRGFASRLCKC